MNDAGKDGRERGLAAARTPGRARAGTGALMRDVSVSRPAWPRSGLSATAKAIANISALPKMATAGDEDGTADRRAASGRVDFLLGEEAEEGPGGHRWAQRRGMRRRVAALPFRGTAEARQLSRAGLVVSQCRRP